MNSEKVKEIKKGLECLSGHRPCDLCFYHEIAEQQETCCINVVAEDVIDYINELESENERLNECYKVKAYDKLRAENKKLKDRIAELEKERVFYKDGICYPMNCQGALKQFAERLIDKKIKLGDRFNIYDIDETLKEFLNG